MYNEQEEKETTTTTTATVFFALFALLAIWYAMGRGSISFTFYQFVSIFTVASV